MKNRKESEIPTAKSAKSQGPRTKRKEREIPMTNRHLRPAASCQPPATNHQLPAASPQSLIPLFLLLASLLGACLPGESQGLSSPTEAPASPTVVAPAAFAQATPPPVEAVLIAVGDIATCSREDDESVAKLVENLPGTVALLGDNVYEKGSAAQYQDCYDPSWGLFKNRTYPAAGNHEYLTQAASGYFNYFGAAAGDPTQGYYSYELGDWHLIALNSNCSEMGGCQAGSAQEQWLRSDLAAHPAQCTLAYWHHPLFSSGQHGNNAKMQAIWQVLYEAEADVVLNGHDHDYERFAPQDPQGLADSARGLREFVVGTGGKSHYQFSTAPIPNSEVRDDETFGVLKLTLSPQHYTWEFIPEPEKTFTDVGQSVCH